MIHEDAVLKKHPQAKEYRPVTRSLSREIFGWTFEVPHDGFDSHVKSYGWVTRDGEVSSDTLRDREVAAKNLRIYMRSQPKHPAFQAEFGGGGGDT